MLSLRPFLQRESHKPDEPVGARQRILLLLLEGMAGSAVEGQAADIARLKADMEAARLTIADPGTRPESLLLAAKAAVKALEDYNRRTNAFTQAQSVELHQITSMLTRTIVSLSADGSTNIARLQAIERQLEITSEIDDIRVLKTKLADCLTKIREETLRQKAASVELVGQLTETLKKKPTLEVPGYSAVDTTTGLGSRHSGEEAIATATDSGINTYAGLFIIEHLHSLNSRFGREVGDQVIVLVAQHLTQNLRPEDTVFRWSGPSFLALLARDSSSDQVRRALAPIAQAKLEISVQYSGKAVLLPVSLSWTLLRIPLCGKPSLIVNQLDAFLGSKAEQLN